MRVGISPCSPQFLCFQQTLNEFKLHTAYPGILGQPLQQVQAPAGHLEITPYCYSRSQSKDLPAKSMVKGAAPLHCLEGLKGKHKHRVFPCWL